MITLPSEINEARLPSGQVVMTDYVFDGLTSVTIAANGEIWMAFDRGLEIVNPEKDRTRAYSTFIDLIVNTALQNGTQALALDLLVDRPS